MITISHIYNHWSKRQAPCYANGFHLLFVAIPFDPAEVFGKCFIHFIDCISGQLSSFYFFNQAKEALIFWVRLIKTSFDLKTSRLIFIFVYFISILMVSRYRDIIESNSSNTSGVSTTNSSVNSTPTTSSRDLKKQDRINKLFQNLNDSASINTKGKLLFLKCIQQMIKSRK